jgi:regulator of protease activity HflC (stomatin/prohibitin superfamily)
VLCFDRIVISVESGELGVLWRPLGGGTVLDTVYREGLHVILPVNKMHVYNIRKQQYSDNIDALTTDGLSVHVQFQVRYYISPDMLPLLHQRVGPDYVNVLIRPEVRSTIRNFFGQYKPEEIYTNQKSNQERISELSRIRLESGFVSLDDVLIVSITLPEKISKAIENKMTYQQIDGEYVYKLSIAQKEASRRKIEADSLALYNSTLKSSLSLEVLRWRGISATEELAKSNNAKTIVIGSGASGLPLILGKE